MNTCVYAYNMYMMS